MSRIEQPGHGDEKTHAEKFAEGLQEMVENSTPDNEDWCPKCEQYAEFIVLQTVKRPDFDVENDVRGCPDCQYTFINQTEWRAIDGGKNDAE